jgi:hypothetical protein
MTNIVDSGTLFSDVFADTNPHTSVECSVPESRMQATVFAAPLGVNVTVAVQVQKPDKTWVTLVSKVTNDGACDGQVIPNPGRLRVLVTASSGAGSAQIWIVGAGA